MARWDSDFAYFPPSVPRAAKGGIRAQSQRGAFGESWWAKRWMVVLDSFGLGSRMQRGRSYARKGQVLGIDFSEGKIQAQVQGSRPRPYEVEIRMKTLPEDAWAKVAAAAAAQALFASKLLAGEMPRDMEQVFRTAKVSLFPEAYRDLSTRCSCPDSANPCKHIAAVYYLLGEEFDRDPFLIFRMRGSSREAFLGLLGGASGPACLPVAMPPEPLPASPDAFWSAAPEFQPQPVPELRVSEAALPRRLGKFPFWRGSLHLHDFLDGVYVRAAAHAADVLTAEPTDSSRQGR
ncbi:MAG TPA: SWIM zinc finger family protein [Bryobacteraceae bacterium]|jgi:uncharacterized Zn finger protein